MVLLILLTSFRTISLTATIGVSQLGLALEDSPVQSSSGVLIDGFLLENLSAEQTRSRDTRCGWADCCGMKEVALSMVMMYPFLLDEFSIFCWFLDRVSAP